MPHHVTQRGIRRSEIFRDEADRLLYLKLFRESCRQFQVQIHAYCLMTNHVHFVAIPEHEDSLSKAFHRSHGTYANRFNEKYNLVGHLWQERPFSCVLDEPHHWNAIRYVERNPVRAGLVSKAADYRWSSAQAHCGDRVDLLLDPLWPPQGSPNWAQWLDGLDRCDSEQMIRDRTFTGRPCGDDRFLHRIEQTTQRDLTPKKPGPKPKTVSSDKPLFKRLQATLDD
jgi:putative transposase